MTYQYDSVVYIHYTNVSKTKIMQVNYTLITRILEIITSILKSGELFI